MDLPSPTSTLITLLPFLLASPAASIPSNLLSSPVLQSHLYLNHSPTSLHYLQPITKPTEQVQLSLEALIENQGDIELSRPKWRIEGDGEIRSKILLSLSNFNKPGGLEVILLWEEDKNGMGSMGLEDQIEGPSWGFLSLVESRSRSSSSEDDGYSATFELAMESLRTRMIPKVPSTSTVKEINGGEIEEAEGTTPGAYAGAEDFWEGWGEEEATIDDQDDDDVINRALNYSEEAVRREEQERYGMNSTAFDQHLSSNTSTGQSSFEAALSSRYDLPTPTSTIATLNSSSLFINTSPPKSISSSESSYESALQSRYDLPSTSAFTSTSASTSSPPKPIPAPSKSSYETALQSRYDLPSSPSHHHHSSSYPSPPDSSSTNYYSNKNRNKSTASLQEDEETGLSNTNYWNSYGSVESEVGEEEDSWGGRNRIKDGRNEVVGVAVVTRSRRSSTIRPPENRGSLENLRKEAVEVEAVVEIVGIADVGESEKVLKDALESIWKLYSAGNSTISLVERKENWLRLAGKVLE